MNGSQEQAIRVPLSEIRDLEALPFEVEIIGILPSPKRLDEAWIYDPDRRYLYLHIRSKYAILVFPGQLLTYEDWHEFLRRYNELEERDKALK